MICELLKRTGDFEIWEEFSQGNTIRFKTKEKRPFTFYSFEMKNNFFQGEWFAEFEPIENEKTRFTATELITYKNPLIRVVGYTSMDLGKFMETYQSELRNKIEKPADTT